MARDYKHRATAKKKPQQNSVPWWKWSLIALLLSTFLYFLFFLKSSETVTKNKNRQTSALTTSQKTKQIPKHQNRKPIEPKFDFYTILPETEVVVPDFEIKTRSREERLGKGKIGKYILQAGAFRDFTEADKLRVKLAFLGIESRIEKAKVKNVIWNRVKVGPYKYSSQISDIKMKLKQSGIDAIVTEVKG